jgi:hypothetical protein
MKASGPPNTEPLPWSVSAESRQAAVSLASPSAPKTPKLWWESRRNGAGTWRSSLDCAAQGTGMAPLEPGTCRRRIALRTVFLLLQMSSAFLCAVCSFWLVLPFVVHDFVLDCLQSKLNHGLPFSFYFQEYCIKTRKIPFNGVISLNNRLESRYDVIDSEFMAFSMNFLDQMHVNHEICMIINNSREDNISKARKYGIGRVSLWENIKQWSIYHTGHDNFAGFHHKYQVES